MGIGSKVDQFIYTLVCNYMPNIRILAKAVLKIFCSQARSYTKCLCPKRGVIQPKIYGIDSKVKQFINTLVCYYMPNIRILAKTVLRYFVHKDVPIQNAYVRKRGITPPKIYGIGSKIYQFINTLVFNYTPKIKILAKAVLKIFCSQGCSYTKYLCPKKGNNSTNYLRNRFKS